VNERAGQRQFLLHAAGEFIRKPPAERRERKFIEQRLRPRPEFRSRHAENVPVKAQVLHDRKIG